MKLNCSTSHHGGTWWIKPSWTTTHFDFMKTGKPLWRISITTTLEAEDAVAAMLNTTLGLSASSHFNVETGVSVVSVFGSRKIISKRGVREILAANLKRIKSFGLKTGA